MDVEDEAKPERKEAEVEADLDEEMLDAAEVDSDEDDWRNAALESPEIADEGESQCRRNELSIALPPVEHFPDFLVQTMLQKPKGSTGNARIRSCPGIKHVT